MTVSALWDLRGHGLCEIKPLHEMRLCRLAAKSPVTYTQFLSHLTDSLNGLIYGPLLTF